MPRLMPRLTLVLALVLLGCPEPSPEPEPEPQPDPCPPDVAFEYTSLSGVELRCCKQMEEGSLCENSGPDYPCHAGDGRICARQPEAGQNEFECATCYVVQPDGTWGQPYSP